jgi:hypothetical protein
MIIDTDLLTLSNADNSSTETIEIEKSDDGLKITGYPESVEYSINVELLKAQINAYPEELVEICFGSEKAIKLKSEKRSQIIALLLSGEKK